MAKVKTRLAALLLALCMVLTYLPAQSLAAEPGDVDLLGLSVVVDDYADNEADVHNAWVRYDGAELTTQNTEHNFTAAAYVKGYIFATDEKGDLYYFEKEHPEDAQYIASTGEYFFDLAYSPAFDDDPKYKDCIFGIVEAPFAGTNTLPSLAALNYMTGEVVGSCAGAFMSKDSEGALDIYTLAADAKGNFYTVDMFTGDLYTFTLEDKDQNYTNYYALKKVGSTGYGNYGNQSLTYDAASEMLYWSQYNSYPPESLEADVNGDGETNRQDVQALLDYASGELDALADSDAAIDLSKAVTYDEKITTLDAQMLLSLLDSPKLPEICTLLRVDPSNGEADAIATLPGETVCLVALDDQKPDFGTTTASGIRLSRTSATLGKEKTLQLSATVVPWNATDKDVTWTTNNDTVATVQDGLITTHAAGNADITVKLTSNPSISATCKVNVVESISRTLNALVYDGDAGQWASFNTENPSSLSKLADVTSDTDLGAVTVSSVSARYGGYENGIVASTKTASSLYRIDGSTWEASEPKYASPSEYDYADLAATNNGLTQNCKSIAAVSGNKIIQVSVYDYQPGEKGELEYGENDLVGITYATYDYGLDWAGYDMYFLADNQGNIYYDGFSDLRNIHAMYGADSAVIYESGIVPDPDTPAPLFFDGSYLYWAVSVGGTYKLYAINALAETDDEYFALELGEFGSGKTVRGLFINGIWDPSKMKTSASTTPAEPAAVSAPAANDAALRSLPKTGGITIEKSTDGTVLLTAKETANGKAEITYDAKTTALKSWALSSGYQGLASVHDDKAGKLTVTFANGKLTDGAAVELKFAAVDGTAQTVSVSANVLEEDSRAGDSLSSMTLNDVDLPSAKTHMTIFLNRGYFYDTVEYSGSAQKGYYGTPMAQYPNGDPDYDYYGSGFDMTYYKRADDGTLGEKLPGQPTNAGKYALIISIPESDPEKEGSLRGDFEITKKPLKWNPYGSKYVTVTKEEGITGEATFTIEEGELDGNAMMTFAYVDNGLKSTIKIKQTEAQTNGFADFTEKGEYNSNNITVSPVSGTWEFDPPELENYTYPTGAFPLVHASIVEHIHELKKVEGKPATCTEEGSLPYWHCDKCGKDFLDDQGEEEVTNPDTLKLPLGEHTLKKVEAKDATNEAPGNVEHWRCEVCGKLFLHEDDETETDYRDIFTPPLDPKAKTLITISVKISTANYTYDGEPQPGIENSPFDPKGLYTGEFDYTYYPQIKYGTQPADFPEPLTEMPTDVGSYSLVITIPADDPLYRGTAQVNYFVDPAPLSFVDTTERITVTKDVGNTKEVTFTTDALENVLTGFVEKDSGLANTVKLQPTEVTTSGFAAHSEKGTYDDVTITPTGSGWSFDPATLQNYTYPTGALKVTAVVQEHVHKLEEILAKEPTCTDDGNIHCWYCPGCEKYFGDADASEEIDASTVVRPAIGHDWDDGKITTPATCEADGVKTFTCKNNSAHTHTETIPATGHDWDDGEITTPATCEDDGVKTFTCKNDKTHTKTETIPAIGHDWDEGEITTPATCEDDGVKTFTCKNDKTHTKTETIPATGHDWDEGKVTKEATCTDAGEKTFTCKNDETHTKTEEIAALGHTLKHVAAKDPTDTEDGNIEYWFCERCGKYFSDEKGEHEIAAEDVVIAKKLPLYDDVQTPNWYFDAVYVAREKGYMGGIGDNLFDPNGTLERGMVVTVLYRMAGEPEVTEKTSFKDVAAGRYYTDAAAWGAQTGVVNGYEDGTFRPEQEVTRQEMALMLMRYAKNVAKKDVASKGDLSTFRDAADVSAWALDAVKWCVENGILNGDNGRLLPGDKATRAQFATIVMRYETLVK